MKNILNLIVLMMIGAGSANAALNLKCKSSRKINSGLGMVILGGGQLDLDCVDKDNNPYTVDMVGFGFGLEVEVKNSVRVSCPFVNKKRLLNYDIELVGPKITANFGGGFDLGVAMNARGALCTFAGVNLGGGASATLNYILISAGKEHQINMFENNSSSPSGYGFFNGGV